ncbi:MAG: hypothetical protein MMC33_002303 [Icmadophila ericetorum]|nr:hypothetical protein [Icmadophila ericetorum]
MKRKADDDDDDNFNDPQDNGQSKAKRQAIDPHTRFHDGLFDQAVLAGYTDSYAKATPYKHGVISKLIDPDLLRSVRTEIQENLSFTPKETDIYKIHQSGDLANLDGLDDSSLKLLPSLLTLRDALYSSTFREYLSIITGAGPLSGRKTDMAINVYTPGCHLLCHDDVIGSRRVSYILYLTDPDQPWKEAWGGALRLYPTQTHVGENGEVKVPSPDFSVSIPPAFNQLSFFAVQPGESFHDVEEVYHRTDGEPEDGGRVRMAISGWYHIPQEGEDGFEEGLEKKLAEKSSLVQLQGKGDAYDRPQPEVRLYDTIAPVNPKSKAKEQDQSYDPEALTAADFDFLLKYLTPSYLTPDVTSELNSIFTDQSVLRLETFLNKKFADALRSHILSEEEKQLPSSTAAVESETSWKVALPPHKHRYLFMQTEEISSNLSPTEGESKAASKESTPVSDLLNNLLPSVAFKKWLQLATTLRLTSRDLLARRFRRGKDYTLATKYEEEASRLEFILGITPTPGWGGEEEQTDPTGQPEDENVAKGNAATKEKGGGEGPELEPASKRKEEEAPVGGYEVYMAGDDDDDDSSSIAPNDSQIAATNPETNTQPNSQVSSSSKTDPSSQTSFSSTGAPPISNPVQASSLSAPSKDKEKEKTKSDPAVYKSGTDGEDDAVLLSTPPSWNNATIVLRDTGVLRFVKYVSRSAKGDRWDVGGVFGVADDEEEDEDDIVVDDEEITTEEEFVEESTEDSSDDDL